MGVSFLSNLLIMFSQAIRKFNLILDKIPVELKKERKILTSQKASDMMYVLIVSSSQEWLLLVIMCQFTLEL